MRCVIAIGGDLGIEPTSGEPVKLTLSDPHGDTVSTITLPTGQNQTITGIDAYATFDEYGQAETGRSAITTGGLSYGWLGAKQRATDTIGLLLMGARLYNPITGLFTSRDPVPGGNTTTYTYPQDPINKTDLTGTFKWPKWAKNAWGGVKKGARFVTNNKFMRRALTVCGLIAGAVSSVCVGISTAAYLVQGRNREALVSAAGMVGGSIGKGAAKAMGRWGTIRNTAKAGKYFTRQTLRRVRKVSSWAGGVQGSFMANSLQGPNTNGGLPPSIGLGLSQGASKHGGIVRLPRISD